MPYSWLYEALDLAQMVMDIWKQRKNYFNHNQQLIQISIPGDAWAQVLQVVVGASGPHPYGHGHPETIKSNLFYYTKQLFFQKHGQKVIPWDTRGSGPTPGCPRLWTSPRWSRTSGNNLK